MLAPAFIGPAPIPPQPPEEDPSEDHVYAWAAYSQSVQTTAAHADTAAGQSIHFRKQDFHGSLRACSMRLDGVGGSAHIMAHGTIFVLLTATGQTAPTHLGVVHNVLYAPTVTATTLFSVSQL